MNSVNGDYGERFIGDFLSSWRVLNYNFFILSMGRVSMRDR